MDNQVQQPAVEDREGPQTEVDCTDPKMRALLRRAAREGNDYPGKRWHVPPEFKKATGPALERALTVSANIEDPAKAVGAVCDVIRTAAILEGQNQTDFWNQDKNDRLDQGKATERLGGVVVDVPAMPQLPREGE
jgi:hypothetical protein